MKRWVPQFARSRWYALLVGLAMLAAVGCGDGRPTRVPVSGRVLIDGQPLTHGVVRFVPENARPSVGELDGEGRFQLTCFDGGDGAVLGHHRVEITASEIQGESLKWHAPQHYADFNTSNVAVDIRGPTTDLTLELSSSASGE